MKTNLDHLNLVGLKNECSYIQSWQQGRGIQRSAASPETRITCISKCEWATVIHREHIYIFYVNGGRKNSPSSHFTFEKKKKTTKKVREC